MLKKLNLRKWANIFRILAITLAPIYIPTFLLLYFGFRIESILASILFVQIYVLVIQAEAMLRQAAWGEAGYDAIFKVSADVRSEGTIITIANCGEKPAYNFFIGFRDETRSQTLKYERSSHHPELDESEAHALSAGRQHTFLIPILEEDFRKGRIALRIAYENVIGQSREIRVVSFEGSEEFFMMPIPIEPGFLLRAYYDLMLIFRWHFRYRKLLRK